MNLVKWQYNPMMSIEDLFNGLVGVVQSQQGVPPKVQGKWFNRNNLEELDDLTDEELESYADLRAQFEEDQYRDAQD